MSAELLWTLIPLAAVIALSPIHPIPAVLMIFSPRAGASSAGYVAAWVAGLLLLTLPCAAVAVVADHSGLGSRRRLRRDRGPVSPSTAKVILGVLPFWSGCGGGCVGRAMAVRRGGDPAGVVESAWSGEGGPAAVAGESGK